MWKVQIYIIGTWYFSCVQQTIVFNNNNNNNNNMLLTIITSCIDS